MAARRRLAAVFFADMVGFSRQVHADEPAGLAARRRAEEALAAAAAAHEGRVVKNLGDGAMLEFPSAVNAVRAALAVQEALASDGPALRVGIHAGDVSEEDGDLFGNTVNLAARLEEAAPAGRVCVSRAVFDQVRPVLHLDAEPLPAAARPDFPEPVAAVLLRAGTTGTAPVVIAPSEGTRITLARAREMAEADEDGPRFLFTIATAFGAAVLSAALNTAAGWVSGFPDWSLVASFLRLGGRVAGFAVVLILGWFALTRLFGPLFQRIRFAFMGPARLDEAILERCRQIGEVHAEIEAPVSRALAAFAGMAAIAQDDVWLERNVSVERYTKQARVELLALLERAQQVGKVAAALARFDGPAPGHYAETAAAYRGQCERLAAAAERFERAEAELARALLLLSDRRGPVPPAPLTEMAATFAALSEALAELDQPPAAPLPARREEATELPLRHG